MWLLTKPNIIMNPEGKIKLLFFGLLFCWTNVVAGQIETRKDTILCNGRIVTFQYPTISKENNFNYEEGFFRTISCIFDSVTITIHCGSMVNLPLTNLTDKNIQYKELHPAKGFNTTRGYDEQNRWFREDTYSDIGLTIAYENAIESKKDFYEWILNDVTTESQLPTQDYTSQKKAPTHDIGLPCYTIEDTVLLAALKHASKSECLNENGYYVLEFYSSNLNNDTYILAIDDLYPFKDQLDSLVVIAQINGMTFLSKINASQVRLVEKKESLSIPEVSLFPYCGAEIFLKYEICTKQRWIRQIENKCEEE